MGCSDVDLPRHSLQVNTHVEGLGLNVIVRGKADFCNIVCQVLCQWLSNEGLDYMLAGGGLGS